MGAGVRYPRGYHRPGNIWKGAGPLKAWYPDGSPEKGAPPVQRFPPLCGLWKIRYPEPERAKLPLSLLYLQKPLPDCLHHARHQAWTAGGRCPVRCTATGTSGGFLLRDYFPYQFGPCQKKPVFPAGWSDSRQGAGTGKSYPV